MATFSSSQNIDEAYFDSSHSLRKLDEFSPTCKALDNARKNAFRVPHFNLEKDRYVIFSDVHKGEVIANGVYIDGRWLIINC